MSFDFKNMTEAQLYALMGIKKKTPEEWEEYYRQERERIQKEQSYLARLYETGEYLIYLPALVIGLTSESRSIRNMAVRLCLFL